MVLVQNLRQIKPMSPTVPSGGAGQTACQPLPASEAATALKAQRRSQRCPHGNAVNAIANVPTQPRRRSRAPIT